MVVRALVRTMKLPQGAFSDGWLAMAMAGRSMRSVAHATSSSIWFTTLSRLPTLPTLPTVGGWFKFELFVYSKEKMSKDYHIQISALV